jgi:hypothetical protein
VTERDNCGNVYYLIALFSVWGMHSEEEDWKMAAKGE